ncbi:Major facilitator family transporter [Apilactobacillus kunkeei]|uniref:MFS transporter n=1 Tax=Apilactobacillus kunkeei TaxID=148814 RepID=UPI0006BF5672|nr:MFS transporter [Apilactobacillus kunkeei]KOY76460.1 Major facilitator family transporter [Apilactobacillus kunkeei]
MKKILLYNGFSNIMLEVIVWMIYLKNQGWSIAEIALLEGLFTISQAIFEFPSGIISDRIVHKNALVLGELVCVLYLITFFFANIHILVYLGFILFALGLSLISGSDVSILYESVDKNEKQKYLKYLGYFNFIGILSMALGNAFGGWIASYSWSLMFIISIIIRIISAIIILSINKNDIKSASSDDTFKSVITTFISFLSKEKDFRWIVLSMSFSSAAITISYQYGPLIMKTFDISTQIISTVFGSISLVAAVLVLILYKITKYISEDKLILLLQIFSLGIFSFFLSGNMIFILFGLIIVNIVFEMWNILFENKIQELAYDNTRASAISMATLCESLILTLGSYFISIFSKITSLINIVSFLGMILLSISLVGILIYTRNRVKVNKNKK